MDSDRVVISSAQQPEEGPLAGRGVETGSKYQARDARVAAAGGGLYGFAVLAVGGGAVLLYIFNLGLGNWGSLHPDPIPYVLPLVGVSVVLVPVVASLQWLRVRRRSVRIGHWLLLSVAPAALSAGIYCLLFTQCLARSNELEEIGYEAAVYLGIIGLVVSLLSLPVLVGLGQWLVLRRRAAGAGWWLAGSVLGVFVAIGFACLAVNFSALAFSSVP
jgi:hypothetical protein